MAAPAYLFVLTISGSLAISLETAAFVFDSSIVMATNNKTFPFHSGVFKKNPLSVVSFNLKSGALSPTLKGAAVAVDMDKSQYEQNR